MASKVPFVKQEINWLSIIPKLLLLTILCLCFYPFDKNNVFPFAIFLYFIITLIARYCFFPEDLHKSIKLIKEGSFGDAIPYIQKSIDYYTKKNWIDKYRFILQISSSKSTIIESCFCNLAYCNLQIGEIQKAKEIYQDLLQEYPENRNALSMLSTINLISENSTQRQD